MSNTFHPEQLLPLLYRLPATGRYWLAFSGGLDSTVLLHALTQLGTTLPAPLSVLHVDHGLSPHSAAWSARCREQCAARGLSLHEVRVTVERRQGGVEAAARAARYAVFAERLGAGETLLTAHHQDDQAETLLLQLLRGGGVRGLAAMPPQRPFAAGLLARPLLGFSREALQAYAKAEGLEWVEDPSNVDTALERNFLRHELLPLLERRRGGMRPLLARSAGHFAEAAGLLDELAAQDLAAVASQGPGVAASLSIAALSGLSVARQRNLLRYWLRTLGLAPPDSRNLQRILDELLPAAVDAEPLVSWPGAEVRRYRDGLYAMPPLPPLPEVGWAMAWDGNEVVTLPQGMGRYRLIAAVGGLHPDCLRGVSLTVRLRQGGERLRLPGQECHHSLKHLLQQAAIPPWQRPRLPLLYLDGELAQVAGLWTAGQFAAPAGESGLLLAQQ